MARRISWTNNSSGHDGTRIYRAAEPMDPQNLPAPIATIPAQPVGTVEHIDSEELADGTYYYRVQDYMGPEVSEASDEVSFSIGDDYSTAQIGDEIGGGIYAGIDSIGGADYHIISGGAASEAYGLAWKPTYTTTPGADSDTDGLANTQAMVTEGITDHPAAEHCVNYTGSGYDWHMPARSQLTLMYSNLAGHAEFADVVSSGDYLLSSSEESARDVWMRKFSDGKEISHYKDRTYRRVRPVRRVPV